MLISRNILVPFLALMVASGPAFAGASDVEPNDSLVAPEVLDIDDPFRRGLDRIADQATGGVDLPQPTGMTGTQDAVGSELLGLSSDQALFSNRYRVMGVAVSKKEARAQIFQQPTRMYCRATSHSLPISASVSFRMNLPHGSLPSI